MTRWSNAFPEINVKESEKDEKWHKDFVLGIINDAIDGRYEFSYRTMQESYEFYDGTHNVDEYSFLQESENGDTLPAIWINYNKIRVKVDTLVGELRARGYDINIRAKNKDAVSEKLDKKFELLGQMNIKSDMMALEQETGIPSVSQANLPETEDELEYYMEHTYKETSEKVMNGVLKYLLTMYKWEYQRLALFKDILIAGRAFVKTEIEEGIPKYKRKDPRYMIFDVNAKDDFLSESTYFGEVKWMSLAEARQVYKLTEEELEEIKEASDDLLPFINTQAPHIDSESNLEFISGNKTNLKVLVFDGEWEDVKRMKYKKSVDKFGNEHFKKVDEKTKGKDIVNRQIKVWRKGTLIGGKVMRDWGLLENMVRSVDNISETKPSYIGLIPNYVNFKSVSKVDMLKGLQKIKDISMYNMQLAMARAGAKGFVYDVSQIPEQWEVEDVLKHLKTSGIAFVNSKKDGIPNPASPFKEFDMTISNSINQYVEISRMIDKQMDEISGINDARQGNISSANQAVGVTQSAIQQSNMATDVLFEEFRQFSEEVFNKMAALVKISWTEKDIFAPLIGDVGVDFINQDIDLSLKDYGVFVENKPSTLHDKQQLEQLIMAAIQSGQLGIVDAMDLIKIKDVDFAIKKVKGAIEKREAEAAERQQAQAMQVEQMKGQQQQQQLMMEQQGIAAEEQAKGQRLSQQTDQTHQNRMKEEVLKSRLNKKEDNGFG
jgi:hypothetical protein